MGRKAKMTTLKGAPVKCAVCGTWSMRGIFCSRECELTCQRANFGAPLRELPKRFRWRRGQNAEKTA